MEINSPSPLFPKSKTRVHSNPLKFTKITDFSSSRLFILTIFITSITTTTSHYSKPYSKNCDQIVAGSNPTATLTDQTFRSFKLSRGFFAATDRIPSSAGNEDMNNLVRFSTHKVSKTETSGVLYLQSILHFQYLNFSSVNHRRLLSEFRVRGPRISVQNEGISFQLEGFWSESLGKLCMVGSGSSTSKEGNAAAAIVHQVVFKANYPNATTIFTSLVNGVLESLDLVGSLSYFIPIRVLGVSDKNYEYTLIEKEGENGWLGEKHGTRNASLGFHPTRDVCTKYVTRMDLFELDRSNNECENHSKCNPLGNDLDISPNFAFFDKIRCSENERMHLLIRFSDSMINGFLRPFDTRTTLVAEGLWDVNKNLLRIVACRISYSNSLANASVENCSIRLNLRFSPSLSLRNMRVIEGHVWSNKSENDKDYFPGLGFSTSKLKLMDVIQGLRYEYTEIGNVKNICATNIINKHKGRSTYPSENSSDLRFGMSLINSKGQKARGFFLPLFVNGIFYSPLYYNSNSRKESIPLNISYRVSFIPHSGFDLGQEKLSGKTVQLFAEGIYDASTGLLCMKGCRNFDSYQLNLTKNDSLDCEFIVKLQFPPVNSKGQGNIKGTIESSRAKLDPFYFDPIEVSSNSISTRQAAQSISRMDLEIAMVLLSNTIACVFVGLQLFYVKNYPNVLPYISIFMLIVLTLGHMIPLILNFEALFLSNPTRQNLFFDDGGWVEKNEVIVRLVTLVAFLLLTRLLQQTWASRLSDENQKNLWISERKVVLFSLPLYIFGGSITYFTYRLFHNNSFLHGRHLLQRTHFPVTRQNYLWRDFKAYGGLIMDMFLLPQILFNLFFNTREKALAPSFYIGTTVLRLLPHAYHVYRSHSTNWSFDVSYIYANPKADLYSTAWDLIVPCVGLVFAGAVYLQQRLGGRFFLPKRYRESSEYEKVAVVNGE